MLLASRLTVPVGAIASRWLLRMPWMKMRERSSSGRRCAKALRRYSSGSKALNILIVERADRDRPVLRVDAGYFRDHGIPGAVKIGLRQADRGQHYQSGTRR